MTRQVSIEGEPSPVILEFEGASFSGRGETSIRMENFSAEIKAGEMVEIDLDRHHNPRDIASSIVGIKDLLSGSIRFLGQSWLGTNYARHFEMRSKIGRVFAGAAWIQNLTVRDNLFLPMLHHGVESSQAESQISHWIERVSGRQTVSVQRSLSQRPSVVEPSILQLCQLVRATCNAPRLLLLERPLRYLSEERYQDFVSVIDRLRASGAAVLFFAGDRDEIELKFRDPVIRWSIVNDTLRLHGGSNR